MILLWEAWRFYQRGDLLYIYHHEAFHFHYWGFSWVNPLPPIWMNVVLSLWALTAFCVALGIFYRWTIICLGVVIAYFFLLEKAQYLNHFYLILVINAFLILIPTHKTSIFKIKSSSGDLIYHQPIPKYYLLIMQSLIGLVYFYGGIAKINPDWLDGLPLRLWYQNVDLGFFSSMISIEQFAYFASYAGLILDLMVWPALLWRHTRWLAIIGLVIFHLINTFTFSIGVFPWLMLWATILFLNESFLQKIAQKLQFLNLMSRIPRKDLTTSSPPEPLSRLSQTLVITLFISQLLIPLRHHLIPGNVAWTEDGHKFSWRMKLRSKAGKIKIKMVHPVSGKTYPVPLEDFLSNRQIRKMSVRPDMIVELSHALAEDCGGLYPGITCKIYVDSFISLNGRPLQRYINDQLDMGQAQQLFLERSSFILPEPKLY